ncbi:CpaF family protein [Salibacterium aidingense]|uniref:CpaF family protein n=1 Tax=Salibacterium aidingense TaxID=384933 RepID=UPI0004073197|nr:CpaF family protein [Salibacterium aidingense]
MSIEEAIKQKQYQEDREEASEQYKEERLHELKQTIREKLMKENNQNNRLLLEPERLSASIWSNLEKETDHAFRDLLLSNYEKRTVAEDIQQQLVGFGVIDPLIKRSDITEIMVNGTEEIFIEKQGVLERAIDEDGHEISFTSEQEVLNIIEKIVAPINRKVDESDPIVDARLPDGSRVNIVIRPISLDGPIITIRKFPERPYSMEELVSFGALDEETSAFLEQLVRAKYNIVISGGTGSGKTTFLNALSASIPNRERIITVEDSAELKLNQIDNLVRLETRPPNIEEKGEVSMRDLVRTALRMRPDRIVVGEVRGGEALDMLQAMNTGHDGSLTTGHANSADDMLSRLETMVLMSGLELPIPAIRRQIASSVELIVQLGRLRDGSRKVLQLTEIKQLENNEIQTTDILKWETDPKRSTREKLEGALQPTGEEMTQTEKWEGAGFSTFRIKNSPMVRGQ